MQNVCKVMHIKDGTLVEVDGIKRILTNGIPFHTYLSFITMNDKSKDTLVCATVNCIRSYCLWGPRIILRLGLCLISVPANNLIQLACFSF